MPTNTIKRLLIAHRQIFLYSLIGCTGALLDLIFYAVFYRSFGISPFIASFLSVTIGIINNFLLNTRYNFKASGHTMLRLVSFYLVGCLGAITSAVLIFILFDILHIDAFTAKILTIAPVVLMQYFINKKVAFSDNPRETLLTILRVWICFVRSRWIDMLILSLVFILFISCTLYFISLDELDNMLGGKLILQGQLPYRDFFSHHAPGMYFLSALLYPFTNNDVFVFRVLFNVISFGLLFLAYTLISRNFSIYAARLYVILMGFGHTTAFMHLSLGESVIALLIPLAIAIVYGDLNNHNYNYAFLLSVILFLVPFLSLAYIFPTLILYLVFLLSIVRHSRGKTIKVLQTIAIYGAPYMIAIIVIFALGMGKNLLYDLFTFNAQFYAPMVGEQGGGVLPAVIHMILTSLMQIGEVGSNILNPAYTTQVLLLLGAAVFSYSMWEKRKRIEAMSIPALYLLLSTRTNIYNQPAISSSFDKISQHAALYISVSLMLGSIAVVYLFNHRSRAILKVLGVFYIVVIFSAIVSVWSTRTSQTFLTNRAGNYLSYAKALRSSAPATVINSLSDTTDYVWLAPSEFGSQLYIDAKRSSRYTFYLPWLNKSPKITHDLVSSLEREKPKIIYASPYASNDYTYSQNLRSFIDAHYFMVKDERLRHYYFNKERQQTIIKELKANGYKTEQ